MKKIVLLGIFLSLLLGACSAKKINENTASIIGDVKKVIDDGHDKSAD